MSNIIVVNNVKVRQDSEGRYSLNDLHKAAVDAGTATASQRPGEFLKSSSIQSFVEKVTDAISFASVSSVKGGVNQGTYAHKLVAIRYAAWIDPSFEVQVYQTFEDAVSGSSSHNALHQATALKTAAEAAQIICGLLPKLGDSARQCLAASFVNPIAGYEAISLPKVEEKFYTATEIAEATGVSPQKVGRVATSHSMKREEFGEYRLSKSQYSSKQVQQFYYNQSGFDAMCDIINIGIVGGSK